MYIIKNVKLLGWYLSISTAEKIYHSWKKFLNFNGATHWVIKKQKTHCATYSCFQCGGLGGSANNNNNDSKIWNFLSSGFLFHILVNSSVSNFIHYISNS